MRIISLIVITVRSGTVIYRNIVSVTAAAAAAVIFGVIVRTACFYNINHTVCYCINRRAVRSV